MPEYVCSECKAVGQATPPKIPQGWAHLGITEVDSFSGQYDGCFLCAECAHPIRKLVYGDKPIGLRGLKSS